MSDMYFEEELRALINNHRLEEENSTADIVLAKYMGACLDAFSTAVHERDKYEDS